MITQEPPDSPAALALISELEEHLATRYATEHRHGYSAARLAAENIPFFIIRQGEELAGCSGLLLVGNQYAEVKRMYIRPAFRRRGLAKRLLDHLADFARQRGISRLRLETGIHQREAIALYEQYGFVRIPAFGHYPDNDISLCFEKSIT